VNRLRKPLRFAYRLLGRHYLRLAIAAQFQLGYLVVLGGIGLLSLYEPLGGAHLIAIIAVAESLMLLENVASLWLIFRLMRPADRWLRGERSPEAAGAAWRSLACLPADFVRYRRGIPFVLNVVPISLFVYFELHLPAYGFVVILVGAAVVLLYGVLLRYFAIELITRPVLEAISQDLPDSSPSPRTGMSLKTKLLVALPAINIVTGVIVAAVSTRGHGRLADLGVDVAAALGVAFTISLELTVLLSRSILEPIADLRSATELVAEGDFAVRVPVISADETGALAESFNRMVAGLAEREALREAFGTYVDPELTERVIAEGAALEGEEVEVSIVFVDIREFTAFAERSSAQEVVTQLNEFFELVVPIIVEHGGHANKFIGDGLLGIFGTPNQLPDHADQAVEAAFEVARAVRGTFGERLRIGIGINSGPVVAGAIGGGGRLEFTVIGDAVNTASRVQAATRVTGDQLLITEATHCLLTRDHGGFEQRPAEELRGKTELVSLYASTALDRVAPWQPRRTRSPSSTAAD
jgi:class 3 adenylate cyclase